MCSLSFRGASKTRTSDAQLRIGESRDSGSGPSDHPGMTNTETASSSLALAVNASRYAATISWRCSPSASMPSVTTSPTLRYCGGFMPVPTPGGVPVVMTSPGNSVMNCET